MWGVVTLQTGIEFVGVYFLTMDKLFNDLNPLV